MEKAPGGTGNPCLFAVKSFKLQSGFPVSTMPVCLSVGVEEQVRACSANVSYPAAGSERVFLFISV